MDKDFEQYWIKICEHFRYIFQHNNKVYDILCINNKKLVLRGTKIYCILWMNGVMDYQNQKLS